ASVKVTATDTDLTSVPNSSAIARSTKIIRKKSNASSVQPRKLATNACFCGPLSRDHSLGMGRRAGRSQAFPNAQHLRRMTNPLDLLACRWHKDPGYRSRERDGRAEAVRARRARPGLGDLDRVAVAGRLDDRRQSDHGCLDLLLPVRHSGQ